MPVKHCFDAASTPLESNMSLYVPKKKRKKSSLLYLGIMYYILCVVFSCYILCVIRCLLYVVYCVLYVVYIYILWIAYCILYLNVICIEISIKKL